MTDEFLTRITDLYREKGDLHYGENVSQLSHALQSASAAEQRGASEALIVASLLHDIGHLLHKAGQYVADDGIDMKHEVIGEKYLGRWFPVSVTKPIGLHVAAKRYLCATDTRYLAALSPASRQSLELQGGKMSEHEVATFRADPFFQDALLLRFCDDQGKDANARISAFESYLPIMAKLLKQSC